MAGRPKKIRSIQSYINHIDNNTFSGPMKMGTAPSIGVTRNYWYNYVTQCNTNPNAVKKSYDNMVFLNINPAQTPVSAGFRPTTNYNYSYNAPPGVQFYDANVKYIHIIRFNRQQQLLYNFITSNNTTNSSKY